MKTVKDVVCPFCGSLCDDIEVVLDKDKIIEVKNACQLGAVKITGNIAVSYTHLTLPTN